MPKAPAIGGGLTESALNPIAGAVMVLSIILILTLPRRHVIGPLLVSLFLIPTGQQLYVAGVHWLAPRIIILPALVRILMIRFGSKKAIFAGGLNSIDRAYFGCIVCQTLAVIVQYTFSSQVFASQFGFLIDFLGGYVVIRAFITEEHDIYRTIKWLAIIMIVLAVGMVYEQYAQRNIFGMLGGTQLVPTVREGKIRSQGAFQHSLTAGTFAATSLPLFFLLWKNGKAKAFALLGFLGCSVMTICSNSSTPLLAYASGLFGICLWPIRGKMKAVRRGLVVVLVGLHLIMKAPVWFLIARIDLTGGSSGYHRAELVDQFINRFWEWWLIGTTNSGSWGWDMWDQQNEFVSVGEAGGLLALILFIAAIAHCYKRLGIGRKAARGTRTEWCFWFLGACMFANLAAFFGVNYFDQSKIGWFILLAMITAATAPFLPGRAPTGSKAATVLPFFDLEPQSTDVAG